MVLSGRDVGRPPVPTLASVLAGTWVMSCWTAADKLPPPSCLCLIRALSMSSARRTTITRPTEPPTMNSRRRCSAFLAAACCAAIRSRALRALTLSALLICPARYRPYSAVCGPPDDQREQDKRERVHARAVQADRVDPEQLGPDQVQHEHDAHDDRRQPGPV